MVDDILGFCITPYVVKTSELKLKAWIELVPKGQNEIARGETPGNVCKPRNEP